MLLKVRISRFALKTKKICSACFFEICASILETDAYLFMYLGLSKIVFRLLFCVAPRLLKPSNECESSQLKSKKRYLKLTFSTLNCLLNPKSTFIDFSGQKNLLYCRLLALLKSTFFDKPTYFQNFPINVN